MSKTSQDQQNERIDCHWAFKSREKILPINSLVTPKKLGNPFQYCFQDRILVGNQGTIYNHTTNKKMKGTITQLGYKQVGLKMSDGSHKVFYAHALVAYVFCDNRHCKRYTHHINGNKLDNRACNLLPVTQEEHVKCHRLMENDNPTEYKEYIEKIRKDNKDKTFCMQYVISASDDLEDVIDEQINKTPVKGEVLYYHLFTSKGYFLMTERQPVNYDEVIKEYRGYSMVYNESPIAV
jgi:hypothetical protein